MRAMPPEQHNPAEQLKDVQQNAQRVPSGEECAQRQRKCSVQQQILVQPTGKDSDTRIVDA